MSTRGRKCCVCNELKPTERRVDKACSVPLDQSVAASVARHLCDDNSTTEVRCGKCKASRDTVSTLQVTPLTGCVLLTLKRFKMVGPPGALVDVRLSTECLVDGSRLRNR
eukprot:TRINITY_DN33971_c0_g1_i1.p1 TRINITY_DN33971_c0_g1~~TRINITY_DN33971_c0_g1_i1.p1  ORF type:complete len:110 (-),score=9.20 TRINITY_DN33971_c0_g1_i1:22-351(-)